MIVDLRSKYEALQGQRQLLYAGLDGVIRGIEVLHRLDAHLVEQGLQESLQLTPKETCDEPTR